MELVRRESEQNYCFLADGTKFKLEHGYDFDAICLLDRRTNVCCMKVTRGFGRRRLPPGRISFAVGYPDQVNITIRRRNLDLVKLYRTHPWLSELLYFMEAGPHSPVPGSEAEFQLHIVKMNNPIHLLSVITSVYMQEVEFYRKHSNIEAPLTQFAIEADEDRREFRLFIRLSKQPASNVSQKGNFWIPIWSYQTKKSVINCAVLMTWLPWIFNDRTPCLPQDYHERGPMRNLYPYMFGGERNISMIELIQELNVIHSSQPWIDSNYLAKFYSIKKGICIIINQQNFTKEDGSKHERKGSDVDVRALHNTFRTGLGFDVDIYVDLTADQLRQLVIIDLPQKVNNVNDYGSLVVCILSHGSKEVVYGVDEKPVDIIDELIYAINDQTCPLLKDKSKLWITQSCQNGPRPNTRPTSAKFPCKVIGDCLWLSSTIPGFVSKRNIYYGSRFIQTLCKHMDAFTPGEPIKDVIKVHEKTTGELKVRLDQIPNIGLKNTVKAVGFLPTSDGKEKTRCFFPKDDPKYETLANYLESTGATFDYDPPVTPVPSPLKKRNKRGTRWAHRFLGCVYGPEDPQDQP